MTKTKKILIFLCTVLLLSLIGVLIADIYVSGQINTLIGSLEEGTKGAAKVMKKWNALKSERIETAAFTGAFFALVFLIVMKVGPEKKAAKGISQNKAQEIAQQLDKEYKENGMYVPPLQDVIEEEEVPTQLDIPVMKSAVYDKNKVIVEWEPVQYGQIYHVWRKEGDSAWVRVAKVRNGICSYTDYNLNSKTHYAYAVKAVCAVDDGWLFSKRDPLGVDVIVSKGNIPDMPSVFKEKDEMGRECVAWQKTAGARRYAVLRKKDDEDWISLAIVPGKNPCRYFDEEAEKGITYHYTVKAQQIVDKKVINSEFDEEGVMIQAPNS